MHLPVIYTPIDAFLGRLQGLRKTSKGYLARCPAHDDRNPSLSIRESDEGTVLIKCHAGCATDDVVASLGLELKDLFVPGTTGKAKTAYGDLNYSNDLYEKALKLVKNAENKKILKINKEEEIKSFFVDAYDLLKNPKAVDWLIDGYIPSNAITFLIGDYSTCKTALLIDWSMHVATGKQWRGRSVKQGPVVFVIGEGHSGFGNRLLAWCIRHEIPIEQMKQVVFVSVEPADLVKEESSELLRQQIEALGVTPAVVNIDTLARNFGNGNENETQDANQFYTNMDRYIRRPFGCAVLIAHHVGHAEPNRGKGARQLYSNADAEYRISGEDGYYEVECRKMKDAEQPHPIAVKKRVVELGISDAENRAVTSICLDVTECNAECNGIGNAEGGMKKLQKGAMDDLNRLFKEHRENRLRSGLEPKGAMVSVDDWRKSLFDKEIINSRQRFYDVKKSLTDRGIIKIENGFVFLPM